MTTPSPSISIAGYSFPLSTLDALAELWPLVTKGIAAGKSAVEVKADLEAAAPQAILSTAEGIINVIWPGSGTILEAIDWIVTNSKGADSVAEIPGYAGDGSVTEIPNPDYKPGE